MGLNKEQCPHCNQLISGLIPERQVPRIRVKQILGIKEEIYAALESNTTWGRNQLKEIMDVIFDNNIENA